MCINHGLKQWKLIHFNCKWINIVRRRLNFDWWIIFCLRPGIQGSCNAASLGKWDWLRLETTHITYHADVKWESLTQYYCSVVFIGNILMHVNFGNNGLMSKNKGLQLLICCIRPLVLYYCPRANITVEKFDFLIFCIIIFLWVRFWIRLAAVSYRGKRIRTVASHAGRSVNKPRDTRNSR